MLGALSNIIEYRTRNHFITACFSKEYD